MASDDILVEAAGSRGRGPQTKNERAAVGAKIRKLKSEGINPDEAVATAMSMFRAGRLGPRGGYRGGV